MYKRRVSVLGVLLISSVFSSSCIFAAGNSAAGNSAAGNSAAGNSRINYSGTSKSFAKELKAGWNLGNTLDAYSNNSAEGFSLASETCWGMPYTTKKMIKAVHDAGFTTIRIPVSWHGHLSNNPDDPYKIDSKWMKRVKEVVDYAYSEGMYVIINIHHDNLSMYSGNGVGTINTTGYNNYKLYGFALDEGFKKMSKKFLASVWEQIAETFNDDYDEHLIFEVMNEPRNVGGEDEWNANQKGNAGTYNRLIKEYSQTCLDAIRKSGGNNAERFVLVPGYAASPYYLDGFELPDDGAYDRLLLSFHAYTPYRFAMWDQNNADSKFDAGDEYDIDYGFNLIRTKFPNVGIVCGETSAENKDNLSEREKWAKYFFETAYKNYGISVILWDNANFSPDTDKTGEHHGYFDRRTLTWEFPTLIKIMVDSCR